MNVPDPLLRFALNVYLRLKRVYARMNLKALAFIYAMTVLSYIFPPPMPGGTPESTKNLIWAVFASGGFFFSFIFTLYEIGVLDWIFKKKSTTEGVDNLLIKPREFLKKP